MLTQPRERGFHVDAGPFGDHALRLLDDDPRPQCVIELFVQPLGVHQRPMVHDGDRGDVGQRLSGHHVARRQRSGLLSEQAQGPDQLAAQAHRHRMDGPEPRRQGLRRETGPSVEAALQPVVHDPPGADAVDAGSLFTLQLEQLENAHLFAG